MRHGKAFCVFGQPNACLKPGFPFFPIIPTYSTSVRRTDASGRRQNDTSSSGCHRNELPF
jgi:hypothetical protein